MVIALPFSVHYIKHLEFVIIVNVFERFWTFAFLLGIYIQSSGSTSVSSSAGRRVRYTVPPDTTCTWQIATTEGYTLELKFDEMSISGKYSCYECSCGYVRVMDGYGSSARSLGTFCDENIPSVVSSTGNHMFIKYYAQREFDYFKASINSRETQGIFLFNIVLYSQVSSYSILFYIPYLGFYPS